MTTPVDRIKIYNFDFNFFYPILLGFGLLMLRRLLDKLCFEPIGLKLGIKKPKRMSKEHTSTFKKTLDTSDGLSPALVYYLNKYLDFIETFYGQRSIKSERLTKFCKSAWNLSFYTYATLHGIVILWDKPWFWDINECWTDLYTQKITNEIWFYNMVNLAYYWSLLILLPLTVKQKDFQVNLIHHNIAILLIYLSQITHTFRIGTLVLLVLGATDIFLESFKVARYLNYTRTANVFVGLFVIVWIILRLGVYPFWIVRSTLLYASKMVPIGYFINALLLTIVALNIFWTILIFKVIKTVIIQGTEEDLQSNSDSDD